MDSNQPQPAQWFLTKAKYRYSSEFEQAYHIFKEEGFGDNPLRIADGLNVSEDYKIASLHDPDKLHPIQTRWNSKTRQRRRIIWGKEQESLFRRIRGNIIADSHRIPGETPPTEEQAKRIPRAHSERDNCGRISLNMEIVLATTDTEKSKSNPAKACWLISFGHFSL